MNTLDQAVYAPKSSSHTQVAQLGYVESYDSVADRDYAYVVYRETSVATGKWVIRIKGSDTAGTVFDPNSSALKRAFKKAVGHDETHVVWGFHLQPKQNDPRMVENRVVIDEDGDPTALEIHLVTRMADHSARLKRRLAVSLAG